MNIREQNPSHRTRSLICIAALTLSVILLLPMSVQAQQAGSSTPEQAAKKALSQHGAGKVLGVRKKTRDDGSAYFEVKILTDGQVSIYEIDA